MTTTLIPDTEGAMRTFLRAAPALSGWRIDFGTPSSSAKAIVLTDIGSQVGDGTPLESARLSFSVYASYDPQTFKAGTKAEARAGRDALVGVLFDLTPTPVDLGSGHVTRLLGASDISALWLPDRTTRTDTPRYVVDATVHAIAVS